jgi:hypothetical protein
MDNGVIVIKVMDGFRYRKTPLRPTVLAIGRIPKTN